MINEVELSEEEKSEALKSEIGIPKPEEPKPEEPKPEEPKPEEPKPEENEKGKRGKYKPRKPKEETIKESESTKKDVFDKSRYIQAAVEEPKVAATTQSENIDMSQYISGALLIIAIDSFFPALLLKILSFVSPKYKTIKAKQIRLDAEEKKQLNPIADLAVKHIFGAMHPVAALGMFLTIMYGGKLILLSDES